MGVSSMRFGVWDTSPSKTRAIWRSLEELVYSIGGETLHPLLLKYADYYNTALNYISSIFKDN